jgi:SAM-dependent methyltransferase
MTASAAGLQAHFERLYGQDDDPWSVRRSWYEQRKRALVLAALPQPRYANAYEAGCGNGEMTAALAPRCERLLAADLSAEALQLADTRLRHAGLREHVTLGRHKLPEDMPGSEGGAAPFDLIILSEIGYYLQAGELALLAARCATALAPGGTLLLCHWRAPFADRCLPTQQVHGAFDNNAALHRLLRHEEDDFLLEAWSNEARSVAEREGLR